MNITLKQLNTHVETHIITYLKPPLLIKKILKQK